MIWPVLKLGDITSILAGNAWSSESFNKDQKGVPIIRIQNVEALSDTDFVYWDGPYDKRFLIQAGDILLTLSGSFRVSCWSGPVALLNQRVVKFTPTANIHRPWFLHMMRNRITEIERMGRHALINNVSIADLRAINVPLPPLPEQQRIAALLDRADALRHKRRDALAHLDHLLHSVFVEMFGDPVRNPKGFTAVRLEEVADPRLGKMLDEKKQAHLPQRPYLRNANVQWNKVDVSSIYEMGISDAEKKRFLLKAGDLLICEGGEPGRAAIWRGQITECYYQKAIHRVRLVPEKVVPEYFLYWIWYLAKSGGFASQVTAATIAHLTNEKLRSLKLMLPPLSEQQKFAAVVEQVESLRARQIAAQTESDALFAALQARAFAGEL